MMYCPHNRFLWAAAGMEGGMRHRPTARELAAVSSPEMARQMADAEPPLVAPLVALARFGRWKAILREPAPPDDLTYARAVWHYARGLAFARTGRLADAESEHAALTAGVDAIPADRKFVQVLPARGIAALAVEVLAGELAAARGRTDEAVQKLEGAVRMQDELPYMEPPPWSHPVRQSLGAVLLKAGRRARGGGGLSRRPPPQSENGGRSTAFAQSLRAQGKATEAAAVERRFRRRDSRRRRSLRRASGDASAAAHRGPAPPTTEVSSTSSATTIESTTRRGLPMPPRHARIAIPTIARGETPRERERLQRIGDGACEPARPVIATVITTSPATIGGRPWKD
jgi:hypothetical protein